MAGHGDDARSNGARGMWPLSIGRRSAGSAKRMGLRSRAMAVMPKAQTKGRGRDAAYAKACCFIFVI